jgi:hypothetical protein
MTDVKAPTSEHQEHDLFLGLKPPTYKSSDFLFTEFVDHKVKVARAPIGYGESSMSHFTDWGMLGNNSYGDCAWAGPAHEHMNWGQFTGSPVTFNDQGVLSDYGACTGFDPATGANDNGTDMREGLDYRRNVGIVDANGNRHKIGGYCSIEPGHWIHTLQALHIFDAVALGFVVPQSAMDQYWRGQPWTIVPGSPDEGGHYVPILARPGYHMLDVVTWGRRQPMSQGFFYKYVYQIFGIFSEDSLKSGKSRAGFNMDDFVAAVNQLN